MAVPMVHLPAKSLGPTIAHICGWANHIGWGSIKLIERVRRDQRSMGLSVGHNHGDGCGGSTFLQGEVE